LLPNLLQAQNVPKSTATCFAPKPTWESLYIVPLGPSTKFRGETVKRQKNEKKKRKKNREKENGEG